VQRGDVVVVHAGKTAAGESPYADEFGDVDKEWVRTRRLLYLDPARYERIREQFVSVTKNVSQRVFNSNIDF
jgi:hypothetical protein